MSVPAANTSGSALGGLPTFANPVPLDVASIALQEAAPCLASGKDLLPIRYFCLVSLKAQT
jgi:hypothetical protein